VKTWLFAIAKRQAFSRQRKVPPETLQLDDEHHGYIAEDEDYSELLEAIEQLPAEQQQALDMIYYRGYSSVEAAARLNISVNTFRSRLQRARLTLRRLLGVKL
jgi:RNA polymerase sigma factor (sigma-70 family)